MCQKSALLQIQPSFALAMLLIPEKMKGEDDVMTEGGVCS